MAKPKSRGLSLVTVLFMFLLSMSATTHEQMTTDHQYKKDYERNVAAYSE
jgi:hypothetical protein